MLDGSDSSNYCARPGKRSVLVGLVDAKDELCGCVLGEFVPQAISCFLIDISSVAPRIKEKFGFCEFGLHKIQSLERMAQK